MKHTFKFMYMILPLPNADTDIPISATESFNELSVPTVK